MKCNNCEIKIDAKFKFAIKYNKCPACDNHIMHPEKLALYTNLQQIIKNNFSKVDAEELANLVIANFELKPLPQDRDVKHTTIDTDSIDATTSEPNVDKDSDEIFKAKQLIESKAILKKMKEEAYEDALKSQFGMSEKDYEDSDDGFFTEDGVNPVEFANRLKQDQKQGESQSGMLSGTGGFSRSDA